MVRSFKGDANVFQVFLELQARTLVFGPAYPHALMDKWTTAAEEKQNKQKQYPDAQGVARP